MSESGKSYNEFLYVRIVESNPDNNPTVDCIFNIVFWPSEEGESYTDKGVYVLYGSRPDHKKQSFIPYRLEFDHYTKVISFLKFTIAASSDIAVELHHYAGWYDDYLDTYFIDWDRCPASPRTEIVAYDTSAEDEFYGVTNSTIQTGLSILRNTIKV